MSRAFAPREPAEARAGLERLQAALAGAEQRRRERLVRPRPGEAAAALATIEPGDRLVAYVGKLIASKGVELLLAAWPLVLAAEPRARLVIVGFGAFRTGLEGLARDLDARRPRCRGRALRCRGRRRAAATSPPSSTAVDADAYRAGARGMTDRIAWAGRLDHAELIDVLPAAEAMVMPSTFPEAFGMVAAEAAACGALPVVADHSGLAEVARTLAVAVPDQAVPWLTFTVGPDAVDASSPTRSSRGSPPRPTCAPRPARRSWPPRASATRGTAWRVGDRRCAR